MKTISLIVVCFGLLVIAGGIIGYLTAQSVASIVMGALFGTILLGTAYGISKNEFTSYFTSIGVTALLCAFFIYRFLYTWKMMPAGVMSGISLAILGILIVNLFSIKKQTERT